ncbi:MAG: cytochrome c oxidase assembly protein [Actinobacteria bacterium]|nr:MAG: cytochrome c oxidase assembly protein [Actinomycetota bacterium]
MIAGVVGRLPAWHAHPDAWALMGAVEIAYLFAVRRGGATRKQIALFSCGVGVLLLASDWPIHDLAERFLYSAHMIQHLLMTLVAAPLLLMGTPEWLARRILKRTRLMRPVRFLGRPVPDLVQFNIILVLSHWPLIVDGTLRNHPLHFVAHAVLVVSALLMWLPVVSPLPEVPQARPPTKMLYLFLQTIVPTVPASFLTFGTTPLYHFYEHVPRLWGLSALTDMQIAGLTMKIVGGFYLWTVIGVIFFRWYNAEEKTSGEVLYWEDVERELKQLGPS